MLGKILTDKMVETLTPLTPPSTKMWKVPEQYRIQAAVPTKQGDPYGAFRMKSPYRQGFILFVIASNGENPTNDWEHVSVHASTVFGTKHTPSWEEMCYVKDLFWHKEACVLQFHPPESEYVNIHNETLHLWRHPHIEIQLPPKDYV